MKLLSIISVLSLSAIWLSCEKVETDPDALDYYKNKNIVLTLTSEDFDNGDNLSVKISAIAVGDRPSGNPRIIVNGHRVEENYAVLTSEMLLDGPITITTSDKAWQLLAEYTVSSNASPYTLVWNSKFNDVIQKPIELSVKSSISQSGIIEIKEYK